jgi:amino acid transporter
MFVLKSKEQRARSKTICLCFVLCSLFFVLSPVLAAGDAPDIRKQIGEQLDFAGKETGLGTTDPRETAARFINYFLGLLGTIFLVYIVYAGYLWMTAGGEEQQIEEAKKHLKNGIIGLIIILLAVSITLFVTKYLIRGTANPYYDNPVEFQTGGKYCTEEDRGKGLCN